MESLILQPSVTLALANADREVSNEEQKVLIVGQMVTAGSATAEALNSNIASSGAPENALFGESAQISAMIRAFKAINPIIQVDAIAIDDDGSGVPRVMNVTFVGTSTEAGTLVIVVGSETLHRFEVAIASGVAAADIPALCVTAINADTKCPFTASDATGGVLDLTADNDGTIANDLGIETSGTIAGITGMAVAQDTAGSADPTLTTVLDLATERYQGIIWPYRIAAQLDILLTWLDARFNPTNAIMDGSAFCALVDTYANGVSAGAAENSPSLNLFADKLESETNYKGPAQNEPSYSKAAYFAAIRSLRLTQDASISRYLTSSASLDQFGGPALASLPYFNTPIPQMPTISAGRGFTALEIAGLQTAGVSVIGVNKTGTSALVGEVVTTYKTDSAANEDLTWKYLNYVDTASNVREYYFNNLKSRFAQSRLTEGNVVRGRDMANEVIIRAYLEKLYKDLSGPNYVLVQSSEAAFVYFKNNITIDIDMALGKVTITMFVPIVTQLRTIIATIKIAFDLES